MTRSVVFHFFKNVYRGPHPWLATATKKSQKMSNKNEKTLTNHDDRGRWFYSSRMNIHCNAAATNTGQTKQKVMLNNFLDRFHRITLSVFVTSITNHIIGPYFAFYFDTPFFKMDDFIILWTSLFCLHESFVFINNT